jgi:Protein of unknown function (DUF2806)
MALVEIPGEKLAIKIWETLTEKGIGGLLTPWQMRREGRAQAEVRRHEKLILAQAEKDAQDILAGRKTLDTGGKLLEVVEGAEPSPAALPGPVQEPTRALVDQRDPTPDLLRAAAAKFSAREVQRFVNLQRIAIHAEDQARQFGNDTVSDEPVDADWLNRWRENAQDVSAEHMQKVWARILTEEFKAPGSYSMGTLEFLRTLSKNDALRIAAIGPYVIFSHGMILRDQPFLDRKQILFSHLLELQEMGIVSGVEAIGLAWSLGSAVQDKFTNVITAYGKGLLLARDSKEPALELKIYRITKLGREILGLGDYKVDEDYIKHVATEIKKQGFRVQYGDWIQTDKNSGRLVNGVEL